jgi:glycosyltransferase involved in cell wall biosynthesis
MKAAKKIGCLVPVYRHFQALLQLLPELTNYFKQTDIIIVDDGGDDFDRAELRQLFPKITCLSHDKNLGKGAAQLTGLAALAVRGYSHALCLDADGQHDPADIPAFTAACGTAAIVIGDRLANMSGMPYSRRLSNRLTSALIRRQTGLAVGDSQCGFRLLDIAAIMQLPLTAGGFQFESQMLFEAGRKRLTIRNVPIRIVYNRRGSSIHHFADSWRFVRLAWRYRWRTNASS